MIDPLREQDIDKEYARLRLTKVGSLGDMIAEYQGGDIPVFGGIDGELVDARIYRFKRRRTEMVMAMVVDVIEPSKYRVSPPCSYFGNCSGCQWQHIDYSYQLDLKKRIVLQEFSAYQSLSSVEVLEAIPSPSQFFYRNHARFTVRFEGQLGFSNRITRRFVRIDKCMLMSDKINEALAELQDKSAETTNLSVRAGINTDDILIQPTLLNPAITLETGQRWYAENMKGVKFRIASPSFFQVNTVQAENMIDIVGDLLNLTGRETLVDAYAGVGTFAILLSDRAGRVIAIEESSSAVEDAKFLAENIENVQFVLGKTEDVIADLDTEIDALILDPPRVGCHPGALNAIRRFAPKKIAYVSCDPSTLARDLDILLQGDYLIDHVQPIDMFPQTYHVECVVSLSLKD